MYRDADIEQAELEDRAAENDARRRVMRRLRREGKLAEAAEECPHTGGYGLHGTFARDKGDPRYGQDGWRCYDCGSVLQGDPWSGIEVIHPCDWTVPGVR